MSYAQSFGRNVRSFLPISWPQGQFFPEPARVEIEGLVRFNHRKYGKPLTVEGKVQEALAVGARIPLAIVQSLWSRLLPGCEGFGLIFGLPDDAEIAEVVHLALSLRIGMPFNYKEQNDGGLVMKLVPKRNSPSNTNSTSDEFAWHTDDAYLEESLRTKWIALYGVRNPPNAWTYYAPLEPVWRKLSYGDIQCLCEPRFVVRMPLSFGRGDDVWSEPRPLFFVRRNGERAVSMPTYAVRPADPDDEEAREALTRAIAAFEGCDTAVSLDPGTFFVFDNDRGLHKRTALEGDRLILRTYIRPSLDELRRTSGTDDFIFALASLGH